MKGWKVDFDKISVGTAIKVSRYVGIYFGKEVSQRAYYDYPIIKLDDDIFHECHSCCGICHGLWIDPTWPVEIINVEVCNISDFLMGKE